MPRLVIVAHSRSGGARAMLDAVLEGVALAEAKDLEVVVRPALEARAADVLPASAVILGTPENFGYMSGALKHFFDESYHDMLDRTRGRPYALFVKAGHDGSGAVREVRRIVTGLAWREVAEPVVAVGELTEEHLDACRELGGTIAAGLDLGIL